MAARDSASAAKARIGWIAAGLILLNGGVAVLALLPSVPLEAGWAMVLTGATAVVVALLWWRTRR